MIEVDGPGKRCQSPAGCARGRGGRLERFVKIAEGLDVAPALAQLARWPECWILLGNTEQTSIPLLGVGDQRLLETELSEVWRLIDAVLKAAAVDGAALIHCRVGTMPPGEGLPVHFDGIDGVQLRRYQIALQSEAGAELTIEGESKCFRPGEAWQIDVSRLHSVQNRSTTDRIVILFDIEA